MKYFKSRFQLVCKLASSAAASVFTGARVYMSLGFEIITPLRVKNSIFIGEDFISRFQTVWSISLEVVKKIDLYTTNALTGARGFRSLYVFRVQNEHSNECAK